MLEFYGVGEKTNDNYDIRIDFSTDKPLLPGSHRTIRFVYVKEVKEPKTDEMDFLSKLITIKVKLYKKIDVYVFVKKCDDFDYTVHYAEFDQEDNEVELDARVDKGKTSVHIFSRAGRDNHVLAIYVEHKTPKSTRSLFGSLKAWSNVGIAIGLLSIPIFFIIGTLNVRDPNSIMIIITFAAIVISLLVIIKGWIITEKMDAKSLYLSDLAYQIIIIFIFAEILGICTASMLLD